MNDILADYLQVWGIEGDNIVFRDSSIGGVIKFENMDVSCKTSDEVESITLKLKNLINSIPDGYQFQFHQHLDYGGSKLAEKHYELVDDESSDISKELANSRLEFYKGLDTKGKVPNRQTYLILRAPPFAKESKGIFKKKSGLGPIKEREWQKHFEEFQSSQAQIIQSLSDLLVNPSIVKGENIAKLVYKFWNPDRTPGLTNYDAENIRSNIALSDLRVTPKGITVDNHHYRVLSFKSLPDSTFGAMSTCLLSLPIGSRLIVTGRVLNQPEEIEKLQTSRRIAFSMSHKKGNTVRDIESEAKLASIEGTLEEVLNEGERLFEMSIQVVLSSRDEADLERQVQDALRQIQSLSGAEGIVEHLAGFQIFCETSFPNASESERGKKVKSTNITDLLPVFGFWSGHSEPSILLRTRSGECVGVNPFDSSLTNANMVVSGGSGAGKSFLTNVLMLHMLKENPRIFLIDIGGSYKKLCENLDGQYISLGLGKGQAINPFDSDESSDEVSPNKLKFLMSFVELITKDDEQVGLPKIDRSEIEQTIKMLFSLKKAPTMSELQAALEGNSELKKYGRILKSWSGDSAYGRFVDRPTTIDLKKRIVCFDLKELESYPDLQAACLLIITDFVWREVQNDISSKKFLIFDECWRLLENEAGSSFIANVFRTFRKYYASAIAISQNMDDFAKSKVAGAVLTNAATKWVLMQKGADPKRLKEVLRLNEQEMAQIESLKQRRGYFSEAFLMAGDENSTVSIETTPLEYWIATTDPREVKLLPKHYTLNDLKEISTQFPNGKTDV